MVGGCLNGMHTYACGATAVVFAAGNEVLFLSLSFFFLNVKNEAIIFKI